MLNLEVVLEERFFSLPRHERIIVVAVDAVVKIMILIEKEWKNTRAYKKPKPQKSQGLCEITTIE